MTVIPREILRVAEDLAAKGREADWRAAVGRAYYAGYHHALGYLTPKGFELPAHGRHKAVCNALMGESDEAVRKLGIKLDDVRERRNAADYYLDQTIKEGVADNAVEDIKDVLFGLEL